MMSFAQMLMRPVVALKDREPVCQANQRIKQKIFPHKRNTVNANTVNHEKAVARYREAMSGEWVPTPILERRLGMSRSSCLPNLTKWEGIGLVERRKIGRLENWNRTKGYEWRFVK